MGFVVAERRNNRELFFGWDWNCVVLGFVDGSAGILFFICFVAAPSCSSANQFWATFAADHFVICLAVMKP
jgi:hypothetical protein